MARVSPATAALHLKGLNGLRSKGGRGRSAAQVSATDAANLLIAIAGSPASGPSVKEALSTVAQFAELKAEKSVETSALAAEMGAEPELIAQLAAEPRLELKDIPGLSKLSSHHSFRDGLVALIEAVGRGEISFRRLDGSRPVAFVELRGPWLKASMSIRPSNAIATARVSYKPRKAEAVRSDLFWSRTFSHWTLTAVAATIGTPAVEKARSVA
jgi:hypothetical protein